MSFTITTTVARPYAATVQAVRSALTEQGFGVLTEIDLAATLRSKLGVEVAPQVILGACRPALAYQAVQADPSIAALLPCNVVVRSLDDETTRVEALDPETMVELARPTEDGAGAIGVVADDARRRLSDALESLTATAGPGVTTGPVEED